MLETSLPGVFAVGDVRHGSVKRVASAVGEGAIVIQQVLPLPQAEAEASGRRRRRLGDGAFQSSSIVWPRPAWSKPSRSPCGFFGPPWW